MIFRLTRFFPFSASYEQNGGMRAFNYTLGITIEPAGNFAETEFDQKVEAALIRKIESRDLGLHVDFLKGVELNDSSILRAFWAVIEKEIQPSKIYSLCLDKNKKTRVALTRD
jgi:hypothetical protein